MIFSVPGIVMASAAVSLPYVVREVLPVLQEIGTEQEQAARTLGAGPLAVFRRITLPNIRRGLAYGVTLTTARVLGEFGAVAIVSGAIAGKTADPDPVHLRQHRQPRPHERLRRRGGPVPGRPDRPDAPHGDRPQAGGLARGGGGVSIHVEVHLEALRRRRGARRRDPRGARRARSPRSSARAAAASRRCCASSPASTRPTPAPCASRARTSRRPRPATGASGSASSTTRRSAT